MPEFRHRQTINEGVSSPTVNQYTTNNYEGEAFNLGAVYAPVTMSGASAVPQLLASIAITTDGFMATDGDILKVFATFKRGASSAARAIAVTIGTATYGTSQLLASDTFVAEETTDETYTVEIEVMKVGTSSITFESSVKCLTLLPTEEQCSLSEGISFSVPTTTYVCFWGTNASAASVTLSKAHVEYLPLSS